MKGGGGGDIKKSRYYRMKMFNSIYSNSGIDLKSKGYTMNTVIPHQALGIGYTWKSYMHITTNVVSLYPAHGEMYSIQH